MTLTERVAYIRGLADGMKLSSDQPNDKLLLSIIETLDDMATAITSTEEDVEMLNADVEELMQEIYCEEDCCEDDCDCCGDLFDDDEDFYELTCPVCEEKIYLSADDMENSDLCCPACGETLHIEMGDVEDCDDCDCDCHRAE